MTTTAWAYLPNAAHIDKILANASAKTYMDGAARDAAWDAARDAAWDAARDAARDAAWDAVRDAARDAAYGAARDAILALIAWDDSAVILDMPVEAVKLLAKCGHHPAVLLLPYVTWSSQC